MTDSAPLPILNDPWRSMTLPGLARGAALLRPDRMAIKDSENAGTLLGRPARQLSALELDREVGLIAQKLAALGLRAGDRVLVQLPNTVEAAIGILGVLTAGGVPAVAAVFASEEEIAAEVDAIGAVAILTATRFAGIALAESARNIAASRETIRFIAAFGESAPAGVAALDSWQSVEFLSQPGTGLTITASNAALITFDTIGGALRAFERTHEQLIAEAAAASALAQIGAESRVLATLPPTTLAGITFGLVAPLLSGASAELVALFDGCAFAKTLGDGKKTCIILPAAAEEAFHAHCTGRKIRAETLILIHRADPAKARLPQRTAAIPSDRTLDYIALGEACGWLERRSKGSDKRGTHHAIIDMFARASEPLTLSDGNGTLIASGPLAPLMIGREAGLVETGFAFQMLQPATELAKPRRHNAA